MNVSPCSRPARSMDAPTSRSRCLRARTVAPRRCHRRNALSAPSARPGDPNVRRWPSKRPQNHRCRVRGRSDNAPRGAAPSDPPVLDSKSAWIAIMHPAFANIPDFVPILPADPPTDHPIRHPVGPHRPAERNPRTNNVAVDRETEPNGFPNRSTGCHAEVVSPSVITERSF